MAKFNEVQKKKRAQKAERKRAIHGDPASRKLKVKPQPQTVSGKRKRKLLKQWRRDHKVNLTTMPAEAAEAESEAVGKQQHPNSDTMLE